MQNKFALRKHFREIRAEISPAQRQEDAVAAARILTAHPLFQSSRHVACYHAYGHEFQTSPIMQAIWQADKVCYLPVLTDMKTLYFVQYNQHDELQPNQHSIPEPVNHAHVIQPERLDMVIMPLVAFDLKGNRIGTGGGYYDRTFAFMYSHPARAPVLLGLGFDAQQCDDCQSDPWDIKLNGILTESRLLVI